MKNYTLILSSLALATACAGGSGGDGYDYGNEGARLYTSLCAVCHGEVGEGGLGPVLQDTGMTHGDLSKAIDRRMPTSDPSQCTGECADKIASFIKEGLTSQALQCTGVTPAPRRLRLLTRREYLATVSDLFAGSSAASCSRATDCGFYETCAEGACEAPTCGKHTFVYDPAGGNPSSVHVAGSFNDWADSVGNGGWALERDASTGVWSGTFDVGKGSYSYKFVVDGSWMADPRSPMKAPDGFGGENSILDITCTGGGSGLSPSVVAAIPVETRPEGYDFDNNADAQVVTTRHLEAYLDASESLAQQMASHLDDIVGCSGGSDCQTAILDDLGERIFRRPLTSDEKKRYQALFAQADGFQAGAELVLRALLSSPHFLYRSELGEASGKAYELTAYEMASALSYTFWGTMPDRKLLEAAERGELGTATEIEAQARRLLEDARSREMVELFAMQWLGAEDIASVTKNTGMFAMFNEDVRAAMLDETRRFVSHVVFDGTGTFPELLTANYTVASDSLARYYGLGSAATDGTVPYDGTRAGVFGHGSVLGSTSHSDQTSPIRRGLFVRKQLLCQELPPPPPNAGGVPEVDSNATTRERFAQHTNNPFCAGCHQYIDGIGFGFERFDPVGQYRDSDNGQAIDPAGTIIGIDKLGSESTLEFNTIPELASAIAASDSAQSCFVRQYTRFVRGARETLENRCSRLALEDTFKANGNDIRELMIQVVTSKDFRVRK